jgi:hypothetical protein
MQAIKNNNSNFGYSSHILNMGHTYKYLTDTMDIIRTQKKENNHIRKIPHTQNQ